jgi:nitrate/nitrite transport system ATP-binding protein
MWSEVSTRSSATATRRPFPTAPQKDIAMQGFLKIEGLSKAFAPAKPVFADVSFTLDRGEFVCIIGHSGCGKTTILNVLAGLDTATGGHVFMDGREVAGPSLERGVVFQSHALMPWLTVRKNIAFAVESRWPDWTRVQVNAHVEKFVGMVGLLPAIDKKPSQLSGGMKQRVGIARAFAIQPKMLLLDEPFGALDALTRGTIQDELMGIVRETQQTVFMITHDVDEAILLADRILLMSNGSRRPHRLHAGRDCRDGHQHAAARPQARRPAPPERLLRAAQPHRRLSGDPGQGRSLRPPLYFLQPRRTRRSSHEPHGCHRKDHLHQSVQRHQMGSRGQEGGSVQGMDHCTVPGPDDRHCRTGQDPGQDLRSDCRRAEVAAGGALQGLAAHRGADRSADLPLV